MRLLLILGLSRYNCIFPAGVEIVFAHLRRNVPPVGNNSRSFICTKRNVVKYRAKKIINHTIVYE